VGGIYNHRRFSVSKLVNDVLDTAKTAAREAGKLLLANFGTLTEDQVGLKGTGDYVTELDKRSENMIISKIQGRFPGHVILAEESGKTAGNDPYRWMVDPLDGTANYVQEIPLFCVSIAWMMRGKIHVGVIYHPHRDEMFWAVRNKGAFLNGRPIRVSRKETLTGAMLATGFPWRSRNHLDAYLAAFREIFVQSGGMRRMGSAALDLAYTACGRFDGFWEMKLSPWDIGAGIILVEEAGGRVSDFKGGIGCFHSGNVVAGNRSIHDRILEITGRHLSDVS
jgi:myo-inositol-1(or 4)-monophosphatase